MVFRTRQGDETSNEWKDLIAGYPASMHGLRRFPTFSSRPRKCSRLSWLSSCTGIRSGTLRKKEGIPWELIEEEKLTYDQVVQRIAARRHCLAKLHISYRLLLQMENSSEEIDVEKVEQRFSVLYLSLRTEEWQIPADRHHGRSLRQPRSRCQTNDWSNWPISRTGFLVTKVMNRLLPILGQVDDFGESLESDWAVEYLERTESPSFVVSRRMAGVAESEISEHVERAADEVEEALKAAHQDKNLHPPELSEAAWTGC